MENANEHARFLRAGLALQNHISVQHRNTSVWSRHAWMLSNCCCLLSPQNLWLPQVAANYMDFLVPGLVLGTGIRIQGITWVTSYWQQIAEELFYDLERAIVRGFLLFQPYLLSDGIFLKKLWDAGDLREGRNQNCHLFMVPAGVRWLLKWQCKIVLHERNQNDLQNHPFAGILHVSPLNTCAQACQLWWAPYLPISMLITRTPLLPQMCLLRTALQPPILGYVCMFGDVTIGLL